MAFLVFPIGALLGWFVRPPRRAAVATSVVGLGALAVLVALWSNGAEVSPLETLVLVVGTPISRPWRPKCPSGACRATPPGSRWAAGGNPRCE